MRSPYPSFAGDEQGAGRAPPFQSPYVQGLHHRAPAGLAPGAGSHPDDPPGLHRQMRATPIQPPAHAPCAATASHMNCAQLGACRQRPISANAGESVAR